MSRPVPMGQILWWWASLSSSWRTSAWPRLECLKANVSHPLVTFQWPKLTSFKKAREQDRLPCFTNRASTLHSETCLIIAIIGTKHRASSNPACRLPLAAAMFLGNAGPLWYSWAFGLLMQSALWQELPNIGWHPVQYLHWLAVALFSPPIAQLRWMRIHIIGWPVPEGGLLLCNPVQSCTMRLI